MGTITAGKAATRLTAIKHDSNRLKHLLIPTIKLLQLRVVTIKDTNVYRTNIKFRNL